eukprot:m.151203 g.151203  ORF g.151203 m.151203 type:complete len:400 (+) comp14245_c1_seq4:147-1346(+)
MVWWLQKTARAMVVTVSLLVVVLACTLPTTVMGTAQDQRAKVPKLHLSSKSSATSSTVPVTPTATQQTTPDPSTTLPIQCQECPAGFYANKTTTNPCFFFDKLGECSPGYCPVPGAAANVSTYCTRCDKNTYSTGAASQCHMCSPGSGPTEERDGCVVCNPGEVSNAMTNGECTSCYQLHKGYVADSNQSNCVPCQAGYMSLDGKSCELCNPGYVWNAIAHTCFSECAQGSMCIKGSTGNETYCQSCDKCTPGHYQPAAGQYSCFECAAGTAQSVAGAISCVPCTDGFYQEKRGASNCSQCPIGFYCPDAKTKLQCPQSQYCPAGSMAPTTCPSLYKSEPTVCVPLPQFYVIIVSASIAFVAVIATVLYRMRKSARQRSNEKVRLLVAEQKRHPVYQGL